MTFEEILDQATAMLQRRGRMTYRTLQRQFALDEEALSDLKDELLCIEGECGSQQTWVSRTIYPSSRRRAYHVLVSDHYMEANMACK